MSWWDAIPAVATAAGSYFGNNAQNDKTAQALGIDKATYDQVLAMMNSGELGYNPAQAQSVGPSAMTGVHADAADVNAQHQALQELQQASREGYNVVDRAAINGLMSDVDQRTAGARDAALARIQPGSGQSIAARLSAQQAGANQANQRAMDIASGSRQKALQALAAMGPLATQMRGQSFGEAKDVASAEDAISKFNSDVSKYNAGQANDASQQGIQAKLQAAGLLRGSTQDYAAGLTGAGAIASRQAANMGAGLGNLGAAALTPDKSTTPAAGPAPAPASSTPAVNPPAPTDTSALTSTPTQPTGGAPQPSIEDWFKHWREVE